MNPCQAASVVASEPRVHDRRKPATLWSKYVWFGGRRKAARRAEEREGSIVDVHGTGLLIVAVAIVVLNMLDAYFTTLFLSHGGEEVNPLVNWLMQFGGHPWPFILLKTLGIGVAVVLLALAKNFRAARYGLAVVLMGYVALLGWHLYLYAHLDSVI